MNMHILSGLLITILVLEVNISAEKFDLDTLNNYSEFLNFGDKKFNKIKRDRLENSIIKSKIDVLGEVFKKNIDSIKLSSQLDIVFLIDASSSVGEYNFKSELKFVKKLLSDVTVDYNHTRVAIVTFSSPSNIVKNVDEISNTTKEQNKCHLLNRQLNNITYKGGDTFTLGAFKAAKEIFSASNRNDSKKVLFLITDGYSNGGDPRELAEELKNERITIFTIGIRNGNYKELYDISSSPGQFYSYLLDSYNEFESLARRALHVDLKTGDYIPLGFNRPCDILCETGDCCDKDALCTCGTTTGHYSCVCQPGYYGTGLKGSCIPCPPRMYSEGPNLCLPCPSPLHITVPPASGIESCKCRSGYTKTSNNGCKELKCPTLGVPDHAYFVKKRDCVNVINSACGIRCEVGYILNGTSIRLCQENATWSGIDPVCEVKTCDRPPTPKDGTMKCFNPDLDQIYDHTEDKLPVDTVCGFKCTKGKFLSGSKQRTCIPLAKWDGLRTICKPIKCKKLPQVKYGKVEPPSCNYGKQEHGKKCKITCQKGFKITGNAEKVCGGPRGTWSGRFEESTCIDTTPPELHCPADITITTLPGRGYGQANISEPLVVDNSDLNVTIWTKPAITNLTEFKFAIGTTNVTYFAQDAFQNVAKCSFQVTVKDEEAPIIENCENPPTFLISDSKGANITWDEPNIFDNSQKVNISKSHDFGFFRIGTTTVSYIATDPSGNTQTCFMNITLEDSRCESLPDPSNGHSDCMTKDDGIQCLITCQDGYAIPISQFDNENNGINFVCKHADPIWYSHDGFSNPECTITQVPEETVQYGEIEVNNTDICNSTEKLNEIENDLRSFINTEICDTNCTIETKPECDLEAMEEESNKILTKRQSEFEAIPHKNRNKKRKKFNIKFQVRGKYINTTSSASGGVVLPNGYAGTIRYDKMVFICPTGFVPRKNRCVQCPKGSYHNKTRNKCHSCPFGFYNNKLGQTECSPCPENHSTRKMHSKKSEDCKAKCPPGTYARRKILKYSKHQPNRTIETTTLMPHCRSCDYGSYQPSYGKISCLQCPLGYTTNIVRAKNVEACVPTAKEICKKEGVCNNGTCEALNNYYYSCNCLKNYIGSHCETLISECDSNPCLNGGTCSLSNEKFICTCKNGFTGKFCEETVEECKYNCLNNGTCVTLDDNEYACICPPGFGGDLCETKLSRCNAQLCQHNGTCEEDDGTFKCHCKNGYIGRRCHLLPCDYKPCKSYEACDNLETDNTTRDSYKCSCPDGFYGENCDEPFDPCKNITCLNGGTCIQDKEKASCICTSLYYGPNCEFVRNSRYYLNFSRYDTNDYIRLPGFQKDLTEITACLWMQTLDNFNYGTLISYATKDKDNAFTITDYTGLVLYINNNYIVTDILLNDGQWHHLCVIWKSLNGSYDIFVGGILKKNGTDLSKGSKIEGNGNMIIGQEQDVLGGMFSQSESFMGKMAYIDIWSRELSPVEILKHLNDCNETFMGDLYPWPEMQDNVKGGVEVLNSSFCLKCEEPKPLYNGFIEIVENVAHYSCYKGFELNNDKYAKGRKCTKASKWEGNYEPFCKRVYCGYPGYIRNGYPLGTKYYYQDRIVFRCYDGYNLIGNSTIQCREDRQWFPEKPRCTGVQCSAFKQPSHSTMKILSDSSYEDYKENVTKFEPGTQIEVNCDEDATLIGDNFLTCLENGTWDLPPPKCDVKEETRTPKLNCDIAKVPRAPENGYVDIDSLFKAGNATTDYIIYKCRNGYRSLGENKSTCIIDGYWTQPNITCNLVTCDKPNLPKNMNIGPDNSLSKVFQFGNTTSFVCNEGYIMIGNNKIRCLMNGKWSRMLGKCIKKSCKRPNVKSQTTISGKSYLFEEVVKITCPSKKSYTLKCNKDGIWEGKKDSTC